MKYLKKNNLNLIPANWNNTDYLSNYFEHANEYDRYVNNIYRNLEIDLYDFEDKSEIDSDIYNDIVMSINAVLYKNTDNYAKIAEIYELDYNPIENYDRYEEWHDTEGQRTDIEGQRTDIEGQRTDIEGQRTDIEGQRIDTIGEGARKEQTTHAAYTDTENLGAASGNTTNSQQHTITNHSNVGDDATNLIVDESTDVTSDSYTNSFNNNAVINNYQKGQQIDTVNRDAYEDTNTKGQQSNTKGEQSNTKGEQSITKGEQSNTKGEQINSHDAHIHGNIGVTTAVAMLNEHTQFWEWFNLYDIIFRDIIKSITIPYYE